MGVRVTERLLVWQRGVRRRLFEDGGIVCHKIGYEEFACPWLEQRGEDVCDGEDVGEMVVCLRALCVVSLFGQKIFSR